MSRSLLAVKHSSIYAFGNIARQIAGFVMLPIYTRYLTPSDYGVVGLVVFAVSVFEGLFGARLNQAVPKFYHDETTEQGRHAVVATALGVSGTMSLGAAGLIALLSSQISGVLFDTDQFALVVAISGMQMFTQALEYYGLTYLRMLGRPVAFVSISMGKLVVQITANVILVVWLEMGVMGVVLSGLISSVLFAVPITAWTLRRTGLRTSRERARSMILFSWPLWLAGVASIYIFSSSGYYIRVFDSLHSVGLYELASRFSHILTVLLVVPFLQYWQIERFRILKESDAEESFNSAFRGLGYLLVCGALGISIFAEPVIRVMAAPPFHDAAIAVPFLVISSVSLGLQEFSRGIFLARSETRWLSVNNYATALLVTVLYLVLTPLFGYVGAAAGLSIAIAGQFVRIHRAAERRSGMNLPLGWLVRALVVAAAAYGIANHTLELESLWADLAFKAVVSAIACLVLIPVILPRETLEDYASRFRAWRASRASNPEAG